MHITHINLAKTYRGGERQVELLVKGLTGKVTSQDVILRSPELANRLAEVNDVRLHRAASPLSALRRIKGTDVVHVHDGRSIQAGFLRRMLIGTPYVATRRILKQPKRGPLTRAMYRHAASLVGVSKPVARALRDYLDKPPRLVYDACDPTFFTTPKNSLPLNINLTDKFVVGHVGELDDAAKGQRQILRVAAELLWSRPDIHFVLLGSGKDEEQLKAESYLLPNVSFVGWHRDVQPWYQLMDAFLFPSRTEALGTALLEAMATGLPVVATRVGGISELIREGQEGFLRQVNDFAGLTGAVLRLADDEDIRARMGQAARRRAEQYTQERMVDAYLDLYTHVAKHGRTEASAHAW